MRNRMIKPEFWQSKTLRKCSLEARLLFIGLWNFCDDFGVCLDSNRKILGEIFPFDENITERKLKKWKNELIENKLVIPVEYESTKYLIIRSWSEHQIVPNPSKRRYLEEDIQKKLMKDYLDSNESLINSQLCKEKEKEKEKEKIKVRENVSLSISEIDKLYNEYGKEFVEKCFDKLDNYKGAKGRKYKSDYRAILMWVIDAVRKDTINGKNPKQFRKGDIDIDKYKRELQTEKPSQN